MLKLTIVGDILISHPLPIKSKEFQEIKNLFSESDCIIGNLETTIHEKEGYPAAFPGGGYTMASPTCLESLKDLGFSMFSIANNHIMDYSEKGLLATIKHLKNHGFYFSGAGSDLAEASKATYYDTANGRIALLSVTSSFHDSYAAGPANCDICGRPGVAPLRHKALYHITESQYKALLDIANQTGINSYHNQAIKEGYLAELQNFKFGNYEFKKSKKVFVETTPHNIDLKRTIDSILEAKSKSDLVVISIHSHQFKEDKSKSPQFIEIFCRECINAGADIIVCTGPHILRGIEKYKTGIIFYGLGNFIFQWEHQDILPEELYLRYGTTRSLLSGPQALYRIRNNNQTKGLATQPEVWESIIVQLEYGDKLEKATMIPIQIHLNEKHGMTGLPFISYSNNIAKRINQMSLPYGTTMQFEEGRININL